MSAVLEKKPQRGATEVGGTGKVLGMIAEFETESAIMAASAEVRDAGFRRWDTHTPYPVHGLDKAMGMGPTHLPWLVLGGGFTGALVGTVMQWWMNAVDYPLIISGKPLWSIPATIPVTFELTILFSAFGAFFGMLALNRLPQFYHFTFHSERFKRHSDDHFFISIEAKDARFNGEETRDFLLAHGAAAVEVIHDFE